MTLFEFLKDFKETHPKKKLRLPKKFVRQFGGTLLNVAFLKPTFGFSWKVGLSKSDNGKVWLNNGWPEFVHHFGLDKGRSLFLRYQGNSEFSVSIFDNRKSISQIYCCNNPNVARPEVNSVSARGSCGNPIEISGSCSLSRFSDDDDDDDDDDEVSSPQRKRMRTRADNHCKEKRPTNSPSNEGSVGLSSESEDIDTLIAFGKLCDEKARQGPRSPKPNVKDKACNPSFVVLMKPTTVASPYNMYFPVKFVLNHLKMKSRASDVVLYGSDGGIWRVKMTIYASGEYLKPTLSGWSLTKFVNDNKLAVGDSCTFELINRVEVSFNVTIDRVANHSSIRPSSAKLGVTGCNEPSSTEPFFETKIRKSPRRYLCVPYSFGSVHLEQKKHRVMLELGERLWPVTFLVCQRRNYLTEGYFEFVRHNSLKHGDICKYEPKQGNKGILKVTIFRHNQPRF